MKHLILLQTVCALLAAQTAPASTSQTLQARHAAMAEALSHSPFGRPLLLQSGTSDAAPQGDVYAVIDHPFDVVSALQKPEHWCALLMLQTNIKRCAPSDGRLQVGVARRYTDAPQASWRSNRSSRARRFRPPSVPSSDGGVFTPRWSAIPRNCMRPPWTNTWR